MSASADELLAPGGECAVCGHEVAERVMIGAVDPGSGPVRPVYGCLPCARVRATRTCAPAWLREDIAIIDAARGAP